MERERAWHTRRLGWMLEDRQTEREEEDEAAGGPPPPPPPPMKKRLLYVIAELFVGLQ
jgi:hypothetical protein